MMDLTHGDSHAVEDEPIRHNLTDHGANGAAVDSIILVYDLEKEDTFHRVEEYWLPLIENCYKGKVRYLLDKKRNHGCA
jgi:hypothetical protein